MRGTDLSPGLATEGGVEGVVYFCRAVLQKINPLLCCLYQVPKEEGLLFVNLSAMTMLMELKT